MPLKETPAEGVRKSKRARIYENANASKQSAQSSSTSESGTARALRKSKRKEKGDGGLGIFQFMQELPLDVLLEVCAPSSRPTTEVDSTANHNPIRYFLIYHPRT